MISPAAWKKLGYTKAVGDFEVWLKRMGELSFTIRRIKRGLWEWKVERDRRTSRSRFYAMASAHNSTSGPAVGATRVQSGSV